MTAAIHLGKQSSSLKIHNEEYTVFFLMLFSKTEEGAIIKVTEKYMLAENKENPCNGYLIQCVSGTWLRTMYVWSLCS